HSTIHSSSLPPSASRCVPGETTDRPPQCDGRKKSEISTCNPPRNTYISYMHTQITPETRALLQGISEDLNAILATIEGCCKCNVEPGEFGSPEIQQDILDARWIARERIDRIQKILEARKII